MRHDPETGAEYLAVDGRGRPVLLNPFTNKGTAFTPEERDTLNLHGLLPPMSCTIEQQLARTYENFQAKNTNLERFIYLAALQDRNETLFFRLLFDHIDEMMPVVYTPVVGEACQKFSHIYRRGRGLYIPYAQRDRMEQILSNVPRKPAVIVVTDGERILGLGDQGAGGMGIPIGKLCLYTLCAGVPPHLTLPIMLDVGTDNEERLADPLYLGERHTRIRGDEYQVFIDQFVEAVRKLYPDALLQWEDFLKENAIKQLNRFRHSICSFNDDIQGTAGVTLAGIYCGLRITGQPIEEQRILFAGAGASAQGISDLLVSAMTEADLSAEEAVRRIWTVDSKGLVTKDRPGLEGFKATYAREPEEVAGYACRDRARITLEEAVENARPTILIGTSGTAGMFTESVVRTMAKNNERPIIFPLSNPTSKAECTAEQAVTWSDGRAIVATGSPFDPVDYEGVSHRIGQGNNAFIFPGVGLGIWVASARTVTDGMFLEAAKALANMVTAEDLAETAVYPKLTRIRECSNAVGCAVVRRAVAEGQSDERLLENLEDRVAKAMWTPEYRPIRFERRVAQAVEVPEEV
ncbi:MAG: NAD-dependent malic enzyme [Acidobacteriota bacterium]|nr:NAD-dependent malic enzyme [Acidobacteriota bacterium]